MKYIQTLKQYTSIYPKQALFLIGAGFYALINIAFSFHHTADDLFVASKCWETANTCQPTDLQSPLWTYFYGMGYYFHTLFALNTYQISNWYMWFSQLIHVFSGVLLYQVIMQVIMNYWKPLPTNSDSVTKSLSSNPDFKLDSSYELSANSVAWFASLYFIFYSNNFEMLYWTTFFLWGAILMLVGIRYFGWWSAILWFLSYNAYETYFFMPLLIPCFTILGEKQFIRKRLVKFAVLYGVSVGLYILGKYILTQLITIHEITRYPISFTVLLEQFPSKFFGYIKNHLTINSSLKSWHLLSVVHVSILLVAIYRFRSFLAYQAKNIIGVGLAWLLALTPVFLIQHTASRAFYGATFYWAFLVGIFLVKLPRWLIFLLLGVFTVSQINTAYRNHVNNAFWKEKLTLIEAEVERLFVASANKQLQTKFQIVIPNLEKGLIKEFFWNGFDIHLIVERYLKGKLPQIAQAIQIKRTCDDGINCITIDIPAKNANIPFIYRNEPEYIPKAYTPIN